MGLRGFSLEAGSRLGLRSGGSVGFFSVGIGPSSVRPSSVPDPIPPETPSQGLLFNSKNKGEMLPVFLAWVWGSEGPNPKNNDKG